MRDPREADSVANAQTANEYLGYSTSAESVFIVDENFESAEEEDEDDDEMSEKKQLDVKASSKPRASEEKSRPLLRKILIISILVFLVISVAMNIYLS